MVHYHGLLQRAYVYLLEYDDQIQSYEERPFSISYRCGKQISEYIPDFRVIWKHQRPRLVTCMAAASAAAHRSLPPLTAAQLWCQDHHHDFAVVTEESLHSHTVLLSNLELLAVHAFSPIPPQTYEYLLNTIISIGGPFSPLELVQRTPLLHPIQTKSGVWSLVYHGELLTDLTQPLHFATTSLLWRGRRSSDASSRGPVYASHHFLDDLVR
jgi:hypothetical protein